MTDSSAALPLRADTDLTFTYDDRHWRVRGLEKQLSCERLKVNLMVARRQLVHVDTLDLYAARMRRTFIKEMGRAALKHKILAVAEEEGVAEAGYALKLLQSEGRLAIATAGKESDTGRQRTQHYEVEGPVAMLLTTTAEQPDAELANRCLVLSVNEDADHGGHSPAAAGGLHAPDHRGRLPSGAHAAPACATTAGATGGGDSLGGAVELPHRPDADAALATPRTWR
ncbi:MAG: hypothetical protein ACC628_25330 [Pirellulaceae bacterium]